MNNKRHELKVNSNIVITQEYMDWLNAEKTLGEVLKKYDQDYRKKICSKCSKEQQKKRKCFRVKAWKEGIQETHCEHMTNARVRKYKKLMDAILNEHPLAKYLKQRAKNQLEKDDKK